MIGARLRRSSNINLGCSFVMSEIANMAIVGAALEYSTATGSPHRSMSRLLENNMHCAQQRQRLRRSVRQLVATTAAQLCTPAGV